MCINVVIWYQASFLPFSTKTWRATAWLEFHLHLRRLLSHRWGNLNRLSRWLFVWSHKWVDLVTWLCSLTAFPRQPLMSEIPAWVPSGSWRSSERCGIFFNWYFIVCSSFKRWPSNEICHLFPCIIFLTVTVCALAVLHNAVLSRWVMH